MNNKLRLIITSTISIILVAILLIGSTYSIFTTTEIDENTNVYKTGNLSIKYTSNNVKITDVTPMTVEAADAVKPHRITVTNNGTVPYMFDVILTDTTSSADNTIDYQYIMTKVGYLEPKKLSSCTNNIIKEDVILPAGESVDIDVRVWLRTNLSNSEMGKSFYAKLSIDGQAIYDDSTDIDNDILSLNYMNTSSTSNFRSDTYRTYIKTASFVDYIDTSNASVDADSNPIVWDMSTKQDKGVIAWLENNEEEGYYNLYIGSKNEIYSESLRFFFADMTNLTNITFNNFSTSLTTDMSSMFSRCSSLTELNVSNFDTSNVTVMNTMFRDCSNLTNLNLSCFNTSNVTSIFAMFFNCGSLTSLDLSNFDTCKVVNMSKTFNGCSRLTSLDVSSFDTSSVTDMSYMFWNCSSLTSLDVSNFDTSNVTNMYSVFAGCGSLTELDVRNWNTSNVTNMCGVFAGCGSLTSLDLSNFDTSSVTNMTNMFSGCGNLINLNVSNWDTSSVTNMTNMFYKCYKLAYLDVSSWNTSKVTSMVSMFHSCYDLTSIDVSYFDTTNVTSISYMFKDCYKVSTSITIRNINTTSYDLMFNAAATAEGAQITVNYVGDNPTTADVNESTEALVEAMIATGNGNVVKGSLVS